MIFITSYIGLNYLDNYNIYDIYLKWKNGTEPFQCFFKSTPFVSIKNYPNFIIKKFDIASNETKEFNETKHIINKYKRHNTIFILDIPGSESIKFAYMLQNSLKIKPILTFNAILHPYGLVQGEDFISNLITYGEKISDIKTEGYIFILDNGRYISNSTGTEENYFNNQYETTEEDMPSYELLKELNFDNVVYIYKTSIKEDISCYFDYLEHYSIKVNKYMIGE